MDLTEKLITLRTQAGLSQLDLAEKLEISRQAISRWEVGLAVPNTENLKVLSKLYGVSIDYLLNDDAEIVSLHDEGQKPADDEQNQKPKFQKRGLLISIVSVVVCVVLAVIITAKIIPKQKPKQITPIENWTRAEASSDMAYTFSIEP